MTTLLLQLPVPQLNFGRRTGNIPLAAACLQQAWATERSRPPYLLIHSDTLSGEEIDAALDYAESRCDLALHPEPDLDIAWRHSDGGDLWIDLDGGRYLRKLLLTPALDPVDLDAKAKRLTHPYQVFVDDRIADPALVEAALSVLTARNPHAPLELVLLAPLFEVRVERLIAPARLARPHYVDKDLRFAHPHPGNRALIITLVSPHRGRLVKGPMCRQVYWWPTGRLPEPQELLAPELAMFDGILIGQKEAPARVAAWQRDQAPQAETLPAICFETVVHQRRWLALTATDLCGELC